MRPLVLLTATIAAGAITTTASAGTISGIEFPHGNSSFADRVVDYSPGPGVSSPYNDPNNAVGSPLDNAKEPALGTGGWLTIEFTDNVLVDQDDVEGGMDLYVFEIGGVVESFQVEISKDGSSWIDLGIVTGQPTGIDIKPHVNAGDIFRFVRVTDSGNNSTGSPYAGADIDAIGAIGSIAAPVPTPTAAGAGLGLFAMVAGRRRR